MPQDDQKVLRDYLQRVMELSEKRASTPTEAELKAIAREVGISEADIEAAERSAQDHRLRGQGFLEHERYDDAIDELTEAAVLSPGRLDIKHDLASAYAGRFKKRGQKKDRQQAETLARRHLELDPQHQGSFALLNELDRAASPPSAPIPPAIENGPGGRLGSPLGHRPDGPLGPPRLGGLLGQPKRGLVGTAVAGSMILVGLVLLRTSEPDSSADWPEDPPAIAANTVSSAEAAGPEPLNAPARTVNAPVSSEANAPAGAEAREVDIPVTLETDLELDFDVRLSRLNNYVTGKSFYTLNAVIENRGDTELEKISVRLDVKDQESQPVKSKNIEWLSSSAPLLPGDAHAVHHLFEVTDAGMERATIVVERVDQTPAADDYGTAKPVQVEWPVGQPAGLDIAVGERSQRFSPSAFGDEGEGFFEAILEVENSGSRTIRALKLKCTIIGQDGGSMAEIERFVATSHGADLRADGQRVMRFLKQVQAEPAGYRISVVDIR